MGYADLQARLDRGGIVILDGGTGTELERRGAEMDATAWCGAASLANLDLLRAIHLDYINAGADIVTANTFASAPLVLEAAGLEDAFEPINIAAVAAAHAARAASGRSDVLVAGSLSHMLPAGGGYVPSDPSQLPDPADLARNFESLANLLKQEGCDLIVLEMMHHPDRMRFAFEAALNTGLPVWAGFSARQGAHGEILAFTADKNVSFADTVRILADYDVAAAGIMHTSPNITAPALEILKHQFSGPLMAYPDSGHFTLPNWDFEDVIPPEALYKYAVEWRNMGVQAIGGCCGLSPAHIQALSGRAGDDAGAGGQGVEA